MDAPIPHFAWEVYLRFQPLAASPRSGPIPSGQDEALAVILDDFAAGHIPDGPDGIERRFATVAANRASKHRRRARLARAFADHVTSVSSTQDHTEAVARCEVVAIVRDQITEVEWQTLRMLSEGYSCREVAVKCETSNENVKSRACRTRARIRASMAL